MTIDMQLSGAAYLEPLSINTRYGTYYAAASYAWLACGATF